MIFNSLEFAAFFLVVYSLYLLLNHKGQNLLLLIASYVFYGAWDYRFLLLLFISTTVDYFVALAIYSATSQRARKQWISCSIVFQLSLLGFFKYFNFFADSLVALFAQLGLSISHPILNVILPVGVSFYTFASMSYTIDIYRRRITPCHNFLDFALFVSFFPQLVAGPIERGRQLIPQVIARRKLTFAKIADGLFLIIWGLFKKVAIADNLSGTVDEIFSETGSFISGEVLIATLFFAVQIYCDFSGYTDIARGISKLMGFDLMLNFKLPYFARNPSDFWRRWHISLSTWLRDYLYISLGGNRNGELRTYRNLLVTMTLGGLWHGAAWNYICWGVYHGCLLAGHRFLHHIGILNSDNRFRGIWQARALASASIGLMFIFTLYGWLLFRARSFTQIQNMTAAFFDFSPNQFVLYNLAKLAFYTWPLLVHELLQYYSSDIRVLMRMLIPVQVTNYVILLLFILIFGNFDGTSFIYFKF